MSALARGMAAAVLLLGAALGAADVVPGQGQPARGASGTAGVKIDLPARARTLVERALEDGRAYALLRRLTVVAPKRLSGTPGAARAVAWGRSTMQRLGLHNVRLQRVMVPRWVRGDTAELAIVTSTDARTVPILALGGSIGTPPEGLEGELVVVRSFEQLRKMGAAAQGKIVLFNRPMPRALVNTFRAYSAAVPQRSNGAIEGGKVGALAVLVRSMTTALDDVPHTGAMRYDERVAKVPAAAVSTKGADALAALAKGDDPVVVRLRLSCETLPDVASANVIGEIPGAQKPEEIVVIGAHLDAWDVGHGAHDDGAGVAHTLEAMRLIRTCGIEPRRTIRAVLFINEENGLRGATEYARGHEAEMPRHVAAIESDAGGFEPKGFQTTARGKRLESLRELAEPMRQFNMGAMVPGGGGADIGPMRPFGVTLLGMVITSHRYFDYHHSDNDRLEAVNERELAMGAAALAYMASCLADVDLPK